MVGTKCDLDGERAVTKEEGEAMAGKIGAIFYKTSAKINMNVDNVFQNVAEKLYKKLLLQSKRVGKNSKEKSSKTSSKDN